MISFKEYIVESKYGDGGILKSMTPERAVKWLHKTRKSIATHMMNNGSVHSNRSSDLRIRYDDHRDWLREKHPAHWAQYCKDTGFHIDHDGSDCFA
jgi:hypothetical protein